jgi:hypothetical protein
MQQEDEQDHTPADFLLQEITTVALHNAVLVRVIQEHVLL